jgi:hypothetical protein
MRWVALLSLPLFFAPTANADDRGDLVAKQKTKITEHLTKLEIAKPVIVETADLLVCGGLPEEKLKTLGESVQKQYAAAFRALKFEMLESPPKGKLAVYFFPERKQYVLFVGEVLNDRVEKDERSHVDARSNEPYVAVTVLPAEKATDLDIEASGQVAVALLQCKAGPAPLPSWMKDGLARAVQWRIDSKAAAERATIKKWLYDTKSKPGMYKAADVWMPGGDANKRLLAASMMDYFVFGSGAASLPKILGGLREDENGGKPTFEAALKSADLTPETLDKAWKKWVTMGK